MQRQSPKSLQVLTLALLAAACRNASEDPAPERRTTPYANAARFEGELAAALKRWPSVTPPSDCRELLPAEDQPRCALVRTALSELQQTLPSRDASAIIGKSGALALSAKRAAEKLRQGGLRELLGEQPSPSSTASSNTGPSVPPDHEPSAPPPSARAPHHGHEPHQTHANPTRSAIVEYARLATLALRQLAPYLEHGSRESRAKALRELSRLGREEPRWKGLESLAQEARLTESDPELQKELDKLLEHLRAERGR